MLARLRNGQDAKGKHLAEVIHGPVIAQRADRAVKRSQCLQNLHH